MTYQGIDFDGTTYSNAEMVLTCNFDNTDKLWKQEKLLVLVQVLDGTSRFKLVVSGVSTFYYTPDSNGYVIVDLSDIARTYDPIPTLTASIEGGVLSPVMSLLYKGVQGLINPDSVIIPYNPLQDYGVIVAPPSVMYKTALAVQHFEFRDDGTYTWYKRDSDGWDTITSASESLNFNTGIFRISKGDTSTIVYERRLREEVCDHFYVMVKWISYTGAVREHIWELVKNTISQADKVSLVTLDNSYNEIKGRDEGFSLRLDGLNAYDYWYYSDVITSSDVEVSFDGSIYTKVQVTSKSVTIPDGNATDGRLEINVNWKHYDAVAM